MKPAYGKKNKIIDKIYVIFMFFWFTYQYFEQMLFLCFFDLQYQYFEQMFLYILAKIVFNFFWIRKLKKQFLKIWKIKIKIVLIYIKKNKIK